MVSESSCPPQYGVCKSKRAEAIDSARSRSAASALSKSPISLKPGSLRPYSLHFHHCSIHPMFKFLSAEPSEQHFCSEPNCVVEVYPGQAYCYWCAPVASADYAPSEAAALRAVQEESTAFLPGFEPAVTHCQGGTRRFCLVFRVTARGNAAFFLSRVGGARRVCYRDHSESRSNGLGRRGNAAFLLVRREPLGGTLRVSWPKTGGTLRV